MVVLEGKRGRRKQKQVSVGSSSSSSREEDHLYPGFPVLYTRRLPLPAAFPSSHGKREQFVSSPELPSFCLPMTLITACWSLGGRGELVWIYVIEGEFTMICIFAEPCIEYSFIMCIWPTHYLIGILWREFCFSVAPAGYTAQINVLYFKTTISILSFCLDLFVQSWETGRDVLPRSGVMDDSRCWRGFLELKGKRIILVIKWFRTFCLLNRNYTIDPGLR